MAGALAWLDQELQPGDWVAISGSGGGLGHIGVQIAARVKKLRVIAIDSGDAKRKLSLDSGAEVFIDFKTEDVGARVLELTGEGAHATIVVPGTKEAFQTAPTLVRNMGTIVNVGLPPNQMDIPISATLCAARGKLKSIRYCCSRVNFCRTHNQRFFGWNGGSTARAASACS